MDVVKTEKPVNQWIYRFLKLDNSNVAEREGTKLSLSNIL
jgi:hypothetical protein